MASGVTLLRQSFSTKSVGHRVVWTPTFQRAKGTSVLAYSNVPAYQVYQRTRVLAYQRTNDNLFQCSNNSSKKLAFLIFGASSHHSAQHHLHFPGHQHGRAVGVLRQVGGQVESHHPAQHDLHSPGHQHGCAVGVGVLRQVGVQVESSSPPYSLHYLQEMT